MTALLICGALSLGLGYIASLAPQPGMTDAND